MKKFLLLFLVCAIFFAGGCGSGKSNNFASLQPENPDSPENPDNPAPTTDVTQITNTLDEDGDGIADIFGYSSTQVNNVGRNAAGDIEELEVPCLQYVNGELSAKVFLYSGTEYVIKYSHSGRTLGDDMLAMQILTPSEREIIFDFGLLDEDFGEVPSEGTAESGDVVTNEQTEPENENENNNENTEPEETKEPLIVSALLEILPLENPCGIFYTFKAPEDGSYSLYIKEINLGSADIEQTEEDTPFEFRIYEKKDEQVFSIGENQSILSSRDVLDLQRVLLENASKFDENGLPTEYSNTEEYKDLLNALEEKYDQMSGLQASANNGAEITPIVYDIPYDSEFQPGAGYYADTGLLARSQEAIKSFTMPRPADGNSMSLSRSYSSKTISTMEEHNRVLELAAMSNYALVKNALGERNITTTNVRLGQISKTIVYRYDIYEVFPRMVDVAALEFTDDAQSVLNMGGNYFREEYGDYFVSGYTWGLRYEAVVSITADTSAAVDNAAAIITNIMNSAYNGSYSSSGSYIQRQILNGLNVSVSIERINVSNGAPSKDASSSIDAIANAFADFVRTNRDADKSKFVPLKAVLSRFRQLPGANRYIDIKLPVSTADFLNIRGFIESIFMTRAYYNAIMSIQVSHLQNGNALRNSWQRSFEDLVNQVKNSLNQICSSPSQVRTYKSRFDSLCYDFRALAERYLFYRKLLAEQNAQPSTAFSGSSGSGSRSYGISSYPISSIVQGDYSSGYHSDFSWSHGATFLTSYNWTIEGSQSGNYRYVWLEVGWRDTKSSSCKDEAHPTVGSKSTKWYFDGGTWRRVEWFYRNKLIYMPSSRYPFVGLKD